MYRKAGADLCQSAASPARQLRERGRAAGGIDIRVGYAAAAAAGISGDAAVSCGLPGGSRALILSDGMGKGIKAAAGSRLVVTRLRRNLKAGMPVAAAIKEVNRYMIEQAEGADMSEEFATVDLTVIDRQSRRARFYKMGAATSFIMRGGRVRKIKGTALPVGIIPKLRLTHISAVLKEGDLIVMVSDGITDADRNDLEARWLCDYLSEEIYSADFDTGRIVCHSDTPARTNIILTQQAEDCKKNFRICESFVSIKEENQNKKSKADITTLLTKVIIYDNIMRVKR